MQNDDDWLESESVRPLVDELIAAVVARYRIAWPAAEAMILDSLAANRALERAAVEHPSAAQLKRTRVFKDAATEAKRGIYYHLRAYRAGEEQLARLIQDLRQVTPQTPTAAREAAVAAILASHASTRERLASRDEFYQQLFAAVPPPARIVDIGCGIHPLMFPFDAPWSQDIVRYCALDNNRHDIACLEAFVRSCQDQTPLLPLLWDLSEGWAGVLERAGCAAFDLALMMKVVPVVERQQRELVPLLCQTPATTWLLTGSRVALTKRASIERRERRVLEEFVAKAGRMVRAEFLAGEEFCWVVTPPPAAS